MTKKYGVYAMGNALVDIEIDVSLEELKEGQIEKGLMTLVDQDRINQLQEKFLAKSHEKSCGGSAANTIVALTQLGTPTFYSCKVASDEFGDFYKTDLTKHGVETNPIVNNDSATDHTGKCMVFISPDADRTMNTYLGITGSYSEDELVFEKISDSQYLYIEGYLVASPTGLEAAKKARTYALENNVKVALTLSDPGIVAGFSNQFKEIIGNNPVDLIFCNEDEALSFTGALDIDSALESLKSFAHNIAITKGPKGAKLWDGTNVVEVDAPKVKAIDTNGAGDLFAGAFLHGILSGQDFLKAGSFACHCSSTLVQNYGARLKKNDLLEIKKSQL